MELETPARGQRPLPQTQVLLKFHQDQGEFRQNKNTSGNYRLLIDRRFH